MSQLNLWDNPLFNVEQRLAYAIAEIRDLRRLRDAKNQSAKSEAEMLTKDCCKGSVSLGTGCLRCWKCAKELTTLVAPAQDGHKTAAEACYYDQLQALDEHIKEMQSTCAKFRDEILKETGPLEINDVLNRFDATIGEYLFEVALKGVPK